MSIHSVWTERNLHRLVVVKLNIILSLITADKCLKIVSLELDSYERVTVEAVMCCTNGHNTGLGSGRMSVITPRLGNSDGGEREKCSPSDIGDQSSPDLDSYNLTSGFRGSGESRKSFLDSHENLRWI